MTATDHREKRSVRYGRKTIRYSLLHIDRKTLEIAVHPDASVVVKAPVDSDIATIEKKLQKRALWILKQQTFFGQFNPRPPRRFYINGETHLYLGKQYRLKLANGPENSIKLSRSFLTITFQGKSTPERAGRLLSKWYLERARVQFNESLDRCWVLFSNRGLSRPKLFIKKMQKRWGSLSDHGMLVLNTDLIRAPKECIDYVVIHELCHLKCRDHSPGFYKLLESVIPDWEKRKHKLEIGLNR